MPEQLAGGLRHFLYLTAVAKHLNGRVVVPFQEGTRLSCGSRNYDIGRVYDVQHLNETLKSNGYSSLVSYETYRNECQQIDVVLLKNHPDNGSISYNNNTKEIHSRIKPSAGWALCSKPDKLKTSKSTFHGLNIHEIICIDSMIIKNPQKLIDIIYGVKPDTKCIGFENFGGKGNVRTPVKGSYNFPYPKSTRTQLFPADLRGSQLVREQANKVIKKNFGEEPYIAIQIRGEYVLAPARGDFKKYNLTRMEDTPTFKKYIECIKELSKQVSEMKNRLKIKHVYLGTDLKPDRTTDTIGIYGISREFRARNYGSLLSMLGNPVVADKDEESMVEERAVHAMIETTIIAKSKHLFVIGGGQFQRYMIIDSFLKYHNYQKENLSVLCSGSWHDWLDFPEKSY